MRDPFLCDGPTVVSFSGGRTSGYMLRRILDAHNGELPDDTHVVFANTGKERGETLRFVHECSERWRVRVRWVERDERSAAGELWREVTFDTASRNGEPFAELITAKRFLPNAVMRFCTEDLKIDPMRRFMRAQGYDHWTNVVGLRRDEQGRVFRVRAREHSQWDSVCPLYDAGITVEHVDAFWQAQPFTLGLRPWESNCDACMLKGVSVLERIERDHPGTLAWWARQERRMGAAFDKGRTYLHIIQRARVPALPGAFDEPANTYQLPCVCSE